MRVLFITEQFPLPLHDGGNLRTYHLLNGLASRHEVTLLSHTPKGDTQLNSLSSLCRVVTVPRKPKLARFGSNLLRKGLRQPLFLLKNRSHALLRRADCLLRTEAYDIIHFNHLDTACFALERHWPQATVFDSHNCLSDLAGTAQTPRCGLMRRAVLIREQNLLSTAERATCARMNVTLVCSDVERSSFQRLWPDRRYEVVPNGVDTDYFIPENDEGERSGVLVFTGAMSYWPNEQAALYFCREILPILRRQNRNARIFLVGKQPTSRVQALHDGETVIVTGEVEDVRPYVRNAQVVVVPLQHGAGTRLKILEAFAMRKAVVSTTLGAEGIPAIDGRNILLADNPTQFAAQVARLLEQPSLRLSLASSALRLAQDQFDWISIQRRLLPVYSDLLAPPNCRQHSLPTSRIVPASVTAT